MSNLHIEALIALGMTPIEAATYTCLLEYPASTGYGLARRVGKPTANTYKALASLEARGAVTVSGDTRRLYTAVAPDEWLDTLERRFHRQRDRAARGLAGLSPPERAGGTGLLKTFDQLTGRIRRMLGRCRSAAVLDLAPAAVDALADDLAQTADGGADVRIKVYGRHAGVAGVECVQAGDDAPFPANAVVDGREAVLATLGAHGKVQHALWSVQPGVVAAAHRAIVAELLFTAVGNGLERGLSIDELEETFADYSRLRSLARGEGDAG